MEDREIPDHNGQNIPYSKIRRGGLKPELDSLRVSVTPQRISATPTQETHTHTVYGENAFHHSLPRVRSVFVTNLHLGPFICWLSYNHSVVYWNWKKNQLQFDIQKLKGRIMKKNTKKEVKIEEITQKLMKLRDELDDYYNNVFIPEYRDNTVFDTHRVDSPEVFDLVVRKKLSRKTEILNEDKRYWRNSLGIDSVGDLPSFQGLLEFEKQIPDSISQLNDDELDRFIESMKSDERNN